MDGGAHDSRRRRRFQIAARDDRHLTGLAAVHVLRCSHSMLKQHLPRFFLFRRYPSVAARCGEIGVRALTEV